MEIILLTPLQPPSLPTHVAPWQKVWSSWILGRAFYTFQTKTDSILTQIQRWICEEQLIKTKVQRLCNKYLLHKFFSCLILTHSFLCLILAHIRTNKIPHTSSSFFFLLPYPRRPLSFGKPPWHSLNLFPLSNESIEILLHQSMASSSFKGQWEFEHELPSNWN